MSYARPYIAGGLVALIVALLGAPVWAIFAIGFQLR